MSGSALLPQLIRFTLVGSVGTLLYLGLFWLLASWMPAISATVLSWVLSTLVTNDGHRHLTFDVHGDDRYAADHAVTFGTALLGLAATTALMVVIPTDSRLTNAALLLAGTVFGGLVRFGINRQWYVGRVLDGPHAPHPLRRLARR